MVNPATFGDLQPDGRRVVITHELTHVAIRSSTTRPAPLWLSEGMADYVGYLGLGLPRSRVAAPWLARVRAGTAPRRLPSDADFDPARTRIGPAYAAAWLACSRLADRYGQARLVAFYRAVAGARPAGRVGSRGRGTRQPRGGSRPGLPQRPRHDGAGLRLLLGVLRRAAGQVVNRRRLLLGGALALLGTGVAAAVLTPWQVLPPGSPPVHPDVPGAFSPAQVARVARFRADLGAWPYAGILAGVLAPWLVVAATVERRSGRSSPGCVAAGPPGRAPKPSRTLLLVAGVAGAVVLVSWLVSLPIAAHSEMVLRRYGLSTQTWPGWMRDRLVGLGTSAAVAVLAVVLVWWLVRQAPTRWPWLLAAAAAVVTVAGSALYPLAIEPLYTHATPLPDGPLRQRIEQLAARDGFGEVRVVVSDASSRTTGENAHVSGLGATRRVDLDDTLVARARSDPDAVVAVVAHELGSRAAPRRRAWHRARRPRGVRHRPAGQPAADLPSRAPVVPAGLRPSA